MRRRRSTPLLLADWERLVDGGWAPVELPAYGADDEEHRFRTRFAAEPGTAFLRLDGLATVCDVGLNGEPLLRSESMFLEHELAVELRAANELEVVVRPLDLATPRRPRARWRTQLADNALRWHRTSLLGRAPGFAPGPPVVGPWRSVSIERGPRPRADWQVFLDGDDGVVRAGGEELRLPNVERWWPHTHGDPVLHEVTLGGETRRVGFRALEPGPAYDVDRDGFALQVNGVPTFARGALWTGADDLRATLELVRAAGMNMLRVPGTTVYERPEFHDLCDELGLLVWQDLMFANFDYPFADPAFAGLVEVEVRQLLDRVGWRPSLAVLCGGSEVEQQAAMLGLDPATARGELLPRLVREAGVRVPWIPSAPSGGALPFRFDTGVANYFGVGGYRRPLTDARLAGVRFASECLAFSNLPDEPPYEPVPGDVGADWDFADVTDHYLALLYGRDDEEARRAVTGEAMAEVFGEWRRDDSPCAGGLVLWLKDVRPGAGWGLLDHAGRPKAALGHLAPVLQPVAVWTTDEGLGGIDVHVANDTAEPVRDVLRVDLYRDLELRVDGAEEELEVPARGTVRRNVEALLGRFVDASYAYRFGPPGHDVVGVRFGPRLALRFPAGRPPARPAAELGLELDGRTLRTRKLLYGARAGGEIFSLLPGETRELAEAADVLHAVNLAGSVRLR
jgi:beta-mannosidase